MFQLRKRLRIFFKNLGFHAFHSSSWRFIRRWKVQSRGVHRDFRGSDHNSLASRTSSCKKHLENFSKVFLSSVLVAGPGNFLATWLSRENRVCCANMSVFKTFQFSLKLLWLFIIFLTWNSLKLTVSLSNKLPFLHHFNSKSSKERYGFSLSLYILLVLSFIYLNLWVLGLIWDIFCFGNGLDKCLLCLDFWVLLIKLLGLYSFAFMVDIDWVCLLICLEFKSHIHCVMIFFYNALCVCFWLIQNGCV